VPCWPSVPEAAYFSVCSLSGVFEGGGAGVSGDESAFIEALDMEVKAAAHDALVQGWLWANRPNRPVRARPRRPQQPARRERLKELHRLAPLQKMLETNPLWSWVPHEGEKQWKLENGPGP
jgi:hypothetical protein